MEFLCNDSMAMVMWNVYVVQVYGTLVVVMAVVQLVSPVLMWCWVICRKIMAYKGDKVYDKTLYGWSINCGCPYSEGGYTGDRLWLPVVGYVVGIFLLGYGSQVVSHGMLGYGYVVYGSWWVML